MRTCVIDPEFALKKWGPGICVNMNDHREVCAHERIYTVGLCGCICTIARRGNRVMLAHYDPGCKALHAAAIDLFRPEALAIWVPEAYEKTGGTPAYRTAPPVAPPALKWYEPELFGYPTDVSIVHDQMVDYVGDGRVVAFGGSVDVKWTKLGNDTNTPP